MYEYLHSFSCWRHQNLSEIRSYCSSRSSIPRSSTLMPMESAHTTSY